MSCFFTQKTMTTAQSCDMLGNIKDDATKSAAMDAFSHSAQGDTSGDGNNTLYCCAHDDTTDCTRPNKDANCELGRVEGWCDGGRREEGGGRGQE